MRSPIFEDLLTEKIFPQRRKQDREKDLLAELLLRPEESRLFSFEILML